MSKENQSPKDQNTVITAVAQFLSTLWMEGEFREQPEYLSEIFEAILETEIGDNQELRTKMISCMKTIKMLTQALDPFSDQQIAQACSEIASA